MEPRANHVLIGAFTLIGALLLVLGALWSARWASDQAWQQLEVHFLQPVSGLNEGSVVQYNGIRMGSVEQLELSPDDPGRVIAVIRLQSEAPLRQDTTARLSVSGLTGVSTIQLRGGSADSPPLEPPGPDQAPILIAEESSLQRLIETSEDIASTASEVMLRLLEFLSEENAVRVSTTLNNIDRFTQLLIDEGVRLEQIVGNVHAASAELAPMLRESRALIHEASATLQRLEPALAEALPQAAAELGRAMQRLADVSARIDMVMARNEAAFSGFGDDVLTPLGPAVQEFRRLIDEISRSLERIDRNPTGFLLGGEQPEEYQPR